MTSKRTIRQVAVTLFLLAAFLLQETWALAGVTGGIGGYVTDDQGKAVAGASVRVLSASQAASATTDASGHFVFLALAPDTYTVSIVKDGFFPFSEAGITVFADQQQAFTFQLQRQLKIIASTTSTAAGALVKSGVGSDIYNVNSATIQAASSLGGGGNLNSAYSAMSAVPGVNVTLGGMGWNQTVYIRGSQAFFTGYEYDGVPVNRAFDNYNASTESNLGLQELQVYTGGGPASNASSGTSGFINQVIKTGTYPGYATAGGGIGSTAFYHQAMIEAGGASPDRNFSYYVGLSGYDQQFRIIDNNNGVSLMGPGGIYSDYTTVNTNFPIASAEGAFSQCSTATGATPAGALAAANSNIGPDGYVNPLLASPTNPTGAFPNFCLSSYAGYMADTSGIADRENVINFHFGIPRKDGQRDDLQLLWNGSMLKTYFYGDANDFNGVNAFSLAAFGAPGTAPFYMGGYVFNAPFGTPAANLTPSYYQFPDAPSDTAQLGTIPSAQQDANYNDQGIVKLQYTHSMGSNAYLRVMGYSFYSDWSETAPYSALENYITDLGTGCCAMNYLLSTHTYGGQLQFSDQLNDKNLLQFTANQTNAGVLRDENTTPLEAFAGLAGPYGIVSQANGKYTCWSNATQAPFTTGGVTFGPDSQIPCYAAPQGTAATYPGAAGLPTVGPNATAAGAADEYLWAGDEYAAYNTVDPNFTNVSLSDQWRPNDKWLVNAAVRYENYTYNLANTNTPADNFYSQIAANNFCYDTLPGQQGVYSAPLLPGQPPPASPIEIPQSADCNAYISGITGTAVTGYVHPNGSVQDGVTAPNFTAASPSSYNLNYWSARYSATYTQSPDTVWRVSGGRFIEPPISASIQYTNNSGNNLGQWANFMDLGYFSPFHSTPSQTSAQYDVSLERHIHGTDMSFKITPFYNFTSNYQEDSFIGPGYVTQVPVGNFRSYGVEGAFTKGDFSRNGLSGTLAVTYTNAKVQFQQGLINNLGANQIGYFNTAIGNYNALAKGGSQNYPCFNLASYNPATGASAAGTGVGTPGVAQACTGATVANPYFGAPQQGLMDPSGWYAPTTLVELPGVNNTDAGIYDAPWVTTLIANYRHDRFAITPSLQLAEGSSYGSPFTVEGVDPRLCTAVDTSDTAAGSNECAYTSLIGAGDTGSGILFTPNPQTGSFDSLGQYRNPWMLVGNLAFSYDLSPRISVNVTVANLFHTCFGGSKEPWTTAYPPSTNICGYAPNAFYVSNYQLGPGYLTPGKPASYSATANGTSVAPWQLYPYEPTIGTSAGVIPPPFNVYVTFRVKL